MESDPTLMCELLVGLGEVDVVGINGDGKGPLWVTVRSRSSRPVCQSCAGPVWSKGDRPVRLVDLPVFGRPVRLWWRKRRWMCPDRTCEGGSFIEQDSSVAPQRGLLTSRAGRWATGWWPVGSGDPKSRIPAGVCRARWCPVRERWVQRCPARRQRPTSTLL